MSDTPVTHTGLSLWGRQVFEYSVETDADGNKYSQTLPGFYEIGTTIDGVDVVILRRKAPGLLADIARAQKAADAGLPPAEQPAPPAPPAEPEPAPAPVTPPAV